MPRPLSWPDCAAAGMTATEAARAMGRTVGAACNYARRHGFRFRDGRNDSANAELIPKRHADPELTVDPQALADSLAIHALQYRADALEAIGRSDLIR